MARDFVAALGRMLTREGNRIGAILYGSQVDAVLPARGGRLQVLHLLQHLLNRKPQQQPYATQLDKLLQAAAQSIRRRSTVFVVSDFISEPGWERTLGQLAQRHDVVAVRLFDPLELQLPDLGLVPMRDAETGDYLMVDTHDRRFRQRFSELAAQRELSLRQSLARSGVDALELRTDDELIEALMRFCRLRLQRLRGRATLAAAT
ncbi:MAG: hypothetical protein FJY42_11450 [Betaproteobacteria bacterium]|nr:hypothetical protein [Betaproteobacteria bacterium]